MMNATADHDQNGYVPLREEEEAPVIPYFPIMPRNVNHYWTAPSYFHYQNPANPYEIQQLALIELHRRHHY